MNEINEDKDLCKFMEIKNIKKPNSDRIKQFFVECTNDISILDEDTKKEFINILNAIKDIYPIYKEMDAKPKYDVKEIEKDGEKFLRLKTVMQITFTDFDDTKHSTEPVELPEETYPISDDLIGKQPIDVIVKREQADKPRSRFWPCCKDQYRTKYYEIVKYQKDDGKIIISPKSYLRTKDWEKKNERAKNKGDEKCQELRKYRRIKVYNLNN